ncbi:hypothetical protein CDL62_08140 [Alkalitalea saponilacus]|nr:hypothetical protein CDL62_08140 [Alkalitalea saponilacus]
MFMRHTLIRFCCVFAITFVLSGLINAQDELSFAVKTSPSVEFNFTTVNQYLTGATVSNAITLNIESDVQWDLYVGTQTDEPGFWNEISTYSIHGDKPPVSILQMRVRNLSNTSLVSGFVPLSDITDPVYIIGSEAEDFPVNCPDQGTNAPGSYLVNPNCYRFSIDLRVVPGFDYKAGLYSLTIQYVLVEDL